MWVSRLFEIKFFYPGKESVEMYLSVKISPLDDSTKIQDPKCARSVPSIKVYYKSLLLNFRCNSFEQRILYEHKPVLWMFTLGRVNRLIWENIYRAIPILLVRLVIQFLQFETACRNHFRRQFLMFTILLQVFIKMLISTPNQKSLNFLAIS